MSDQDEESDEITGCPDCDYNAGGVFGEWGNGKCSHCHGTGKFDSMIDKIVDVAGGYDLSDHDDCYECHGSKICQTCHGTGVVLKERRENSREEDVRAREDESADTRENSYDNPGGSSPGYEGSASGSSKDYLSSRSSSLPPRMKSGTPFWPLILILFILVGVFVSWEKRPTDSQPPPLHRNTAQEAEAQRQRKAQQEAEAQRQRKAQQEAEAQRQRKAQQEAEAQRQRKAQQEAEAQRQRKAQQEAEAQRQRKAQQEAEAQWQQNIREIERNIEAQRQQNMRNIEAQRQQNMRNIEAQQQQNRRAIEAQQQQNR
jgi:hypothetical protein